jgi:regulator of protease activity HflC (stomatin/prohibitin superfamily)
MPFIKAKPNQYLVAGRNGVVKNYGTAVSTFLWPNTTFVLIPSTQQEAAFEMTQESTDGIPLRFKGMVLYRISAPEIVASRFDFSDNRGQEEIKAMISHVCLGELRAVVSHMTMKECIEERKTTLTDTVRNALQQVINGKDGGRDWGIDLEVVQVAQVFIVDNELRKQLEAEVRNQIKSTSELSDIKMQEEIELAKASSERRLHQEALETEKQRLDIAQQTMELQKRFESEQIEKDAPVQLLRIQRQEEILKQELKMRKLEHEVKTLETKTNILADKAKQDLRKEILPVEQVPEIAKAVSQMLKGANLSVYGESAGPLVSAIGPLVELLANTLRAVNQENAEPE